jgi:phytoene dehydrogenase-like protein
MEPREIVVIGAGLGGLCTAALLARAGHRVRVLDQAAHVGGRARSRAEHGFVHNAGAHALYRGGPALETLRALEIAPRAKSAVGEGGYVLKNDRLEHLPRGPLTMLSTGALDLRGKLAFGRTLMSLGEAKALSLRGKTVSEWLEAEAPDPNARGMLAMFVRLATYSHAPDLLAADAAVRQLHRAVSRGVLYIEGGWQMLVDAAAERACAAGAQIETESGAARIEYDGAVTAVVTSQGRRIPASAVVAALGPQALAALLPEDARARRWAAECTPLRAACLDVGVRALAYPDRKFVLGIDAPLYYADHSSVAPSLAPAGAATLHLVRYLRPGEDGRACEAELVQFLERIQPGACARADVKRFMPNLTVHNDIPGRARAPSAHPAIAGLHVVSDWVDSHMLLDGVLASAREVAERLQARHAGRAA